MRYPGWNILYGLTIFLISCNSQHILVSHDHDLVKLVPDKNFDQFYSTKSLDKGLSKYLLKERKFDFQMADSGELVNTTDMRVKGLPDKRLIVFGKGPTNLFCILYNERENQSSNSCLIYVKKRNLYTVCFLTVSVSVNNIDELKVALKDGQYDLIAGR